MIISQFILLRQQRVVTHCRHKSGGIKKVGSFWLDVSQGCGRNPILPWSTLRPMPYQQQLPMTHCSRLPFKPTSWFQSADDTGILPASQLNSPFLSQFQHLLRRHVVAVPALATTFLQQWLPSCTSDHLPAPAATNPTTAVTTSPDNNYQSRTSNTVLHQRLDPAPATSFLDFYGPASAVRYSNFDSL